MTTEERARRLVGDMPWITEGLSDATIEDLIAQIRASIDAAITEFHAATGMGPTKQRFGTFTYREIARSAYDAYEYSMLTQTEYTSRQFENCPDQVRIAWEAAIRQALTLLYAPHTMGREDRWAGWIPPE